MRLRDVTIVTAVLSLALGGCATSEEWGTWKSHPVHFASGDHLAFSLQNTAGGSPKVARRDIVQASNERWWGKAITVGQEQIIER